MRGDVTDVDKDEDDDLASAACDTLPRLIHPAASESTIMTIMA